MPSAVAKLTELGANRSPLRVTVNTATVPAAVSVTDTLSILNVGSGGSAVIVAVAVGAFKITLVLEDVTEIENVSAPSLRPLAKTGTLTTASVWPMPKVTDPDTASKSAPAVAVPPVTA